MPDATPSGSSLSVQPTVPSRPASEIVGGLLDEQSQRWQRGDPLPVEAYLQQYPALEADAHGLLDLIYHELLLRERHGETPQLEEYLQRFPQYQEQFRRQFLLHEALASAAGAAGTTPPGQPAGSSGEESATAPTTGMAMRYRPLRFHNRGNLGEVFLAYDKELQREVALKRIRPQHAANRDSVRRFLVEAQITSRLEHPGIVPVHGLTQDQDGQPWYAMRFIEGETLADAIARFHEAEKPGRDPGERGLALRQLLSRFIAVCNTVGYAHSRGVLHRDLKPANIMLGQYGETLVVDWGLAKQQSAVRGQKAAIGQPAAAKGSTEVTVSELETPPGGVVGTPAFMSPEQAGGQTDLIGPASDIYSLGATLYMLLTGQAPFEGDLRQVLVQVRTGVFPRPRQQKKDIPVALEAICLKAMALLPAYRYATALELAVEVEHWLADEPVTAYHESLPAQLGRWTRRHRPLVAATAGLLLTAVAALGVGIIVINQEKDRTETARQQTAVALEAETQARKDEAAAREQAMSALRAMTNEVVEQQMGRRAQLTEKDKGFLRRILKHYESFADVRGDGPESRAIRAEGLAKVGMLRHRLGELKQAEADYRHALKLRAQLATDFPEVASYRRVLAWSHNDLAILLDATSRPLEAEGAYREALALKKQLAAEFPDVPAYRKDLASSYNNLGHKLTSMGKSPEAEEALRNALVLYNQLTIEFPAVPEYRHQRGRSYTNLGNLLANTSRPKEAKEAYHEGLASYKQLLAAFPEDPSYRQDLARSYNNLAYLQGNLLKDAGGLHEAEEAYRDALVLYKQLAADFPAVPGYRQELAGRHINLGKLLEDMDRPKEAEGAYHDALVLYKQLAADLPAVPSYRQELAMCHNNLGILLRSTGRPKEAEGAYRDALAIRKQLAEAFPTVVEHRKELAGSYNNLGTILRDTSGPQEAETAYREAFALYKQLVTESPSVPDYNNELAVTMVNLAMLLRDRTAFLQARELLEDAVPHHQAALKANSRNPLYRLSFQGNRATLASTLAGLGDHVGTVQTAEQMATLGWDPAADAYNAVCALASCIPVAEKDTKLPEAKRQELGRSYADRAVAMLRQAVTKGFKDAAHMKKNTDLDSLRTHPEFQKLLAELESKAKPAGK